MLRSLTLGIRELSMVEASVEASRRLAWVASLACSVPRKECMGKGVGVRALLMCYWSKQITWVDPKTLWQEACGCERHGNPRNNPLRLPTTNSSTSQRTLLLWKSTVQHHAPASHHLPPATWLLDSEQGCGEEGNSRSDTGYSRCFTVTCFPGQE